MKSNPKGEEIFKEYDKTKTLSDATRRQMINILVAEMTESYGRIPPTSVRTSYALGIVTLFPYLQDPYSKHGYHGLYPAKSLRLRCGEQGCPSSFCTYNGFRKHLNNVHHHDEQVNTNQEVITQTQRHFEMES
ncbi:hypothetical protein F7725_000002, partial [Dissostichus mawsoni]